MLLLLLLHICCCCFCCSSIRPRYLALLINPYPPDPPTHRLIKWILSCFFDFVDEKDGEKASFFEASKNGNNLVPLYRCIFSDHLTPVLAYRCLVSEDDRDAPSFLFESVEQASHGSNVVRFPLPPSSSSRFFFFLRFNQSINNFGNKSMIRNSAYQITG